LRTLFPARLIIPIRLSPLRFTSDVAISDFELGYHGVAAAGFWLPLSSAHAVDCGIVSAAVTAAATALC
jgi:hypothetical protein